MMGDVRMDFAESNTPSTEPVEIIRPVDNHEKEAMSWSLLTTWMIQHENDLFCKK